MLQIGDTGVHWKERLPLLAPAPTPQRILVRPLSVKAEVTAYTLALKAGEMSFPSGSRKKIDWSIHPHVLSPPLCPHAHHLYLAQNSRQKKKKKPKNSFQLKGRKVAHSHWGKPHCSLIRLPATAYTYNLELQLMCLIPQKEKAPLRTLGIPFCLVSSSCRPEFPLASPNFPQVLLDGAMPEVWWLWYVI